MGDVIPLAVVEAVWADLSHTVPSDTYEAWRQAPWTARAQDPNAYEKEEAADLARQYLDLREFLESAEFKWS